MKYMYPKVLHNFLITLFVWGWFWIKWTQSICTRRTIAFHSYYIFFKKKFTQGLIGCYHFFWFWFPFLSSIVFRTPSYSLRWNGCLQIGTALTNFISHQITPLTESHASFQNILPCSIFILNGDGGKIRQLYIWQAELGLIMLTEHTWCWQCSVALMKSDKTYLSTLQQVFFSLANA